MSEKELLELLEKYYGFTSFRGAQLAAIQAALRGQDCLVLLPTGGGKSLCYCLPALAKRGLVLVISPLIALMEDQVHGLQAKGIPADLLSSQRKEKDRGRILADVQSDKPSLKLLFVTPELIATEGFSKVLRSMHAKRNITLVAVDESHCISSWGHDFRPAYRKLSSLKRLLPSVPLMALTATATKKVQNDIVGSLTLENPLRLLGSFDRPNIHFSVRPLKDADDPVPAVAKSLMQTGQRSACAIIYTLKRDTADDVAARLRAAGITCQAYHAGLKDADRSKVLADWTAGRVPVVAATIAFGMGIDKPDVRHVYHLNLPKTVEGYYQESGRAGRDGLQARSVCFYKESDRERMTWILEQQSKSKKRKHQAPKKDDEQQHAERAFNQVVAFCTEPKCRRAMLLAHFGEALSGACAGCDYCDNPAAVSSQLAALAAERASGNGMGQQTSRRRRNGRKRAANGSDSESSTGEERSDSDETQEHQDTESVEAEKVALTARKQGADAVFDALQNAEEQADKKDAKAKRVRLTSSSAAADSKLPNKIVIGAPPVVEETRIAARNRILKALHNNKAVVDTGAASLEATAEALEADCYAASASKAVYLGKLASTTRAAAQLQSTAVVEAINGSINATSLENAVTEVEALERTSGSSQAVVSKLQSMEAMKVTAEALKSRDIGKRVKALGKSHVSEIAAAAKAVVTTWKAQLLQD